MCKNAVCEHPRVETHLVRSTGYPLGLFSDYSNHGTEFSVKVREKEHNWVEIFTPDGRLYMSMIGRDKKFLFDSQGSAVLNVRNRALNFGGEYQVGRRDLRSISHSFLTSHVQVFEGDGDKLPLFAIRNKWSFGGPKMVASFTNFDEKTIELQLRGKLLSSSGKIVLGDQPVARFEGGIMEPIAGQPGKSETVSKMIIAPLGTYTPRVVVSYL